MQEIYETQEIEQVEELQEPKEIIKPIKKVIFKNNSLEQLGVKVNLTKDKEYEVLSVKVPVQYDIKPAVNNSTLYLIKDDNGEKHYFRANFFKNKEY